MYWVLWNYQNVRTGYFSIYLSILSTIHMLTVYSTIHSCFLYSFILSNINPIIYLFFHSANNFINFILSPGHFFLFRHWFTHPFIYPFNHSFVCFFVINTLIHLCCSLPENIYSLVSAYLTFINVKIYVNIDFSMWKH